VLSVLHTFPAPVEPTPIELVSFATRSAAYSLPGLAYQHGLLSSSPWQEEGQKHSPVAAASGNAGRSSASSGSYCSY